MLKTRGACCARVSRLASGEASTLQHPHRFSLVSRALLFNSVQFLGFLAAVLALYYLLPGRRAQNLLLLVGSYVFYGAWDWRFLGLIGLSTLVDYLAAQRIEAAAQAGLPRRKTGWLFVSLGVNLGLLGFFKYADFGIASMAALLETLGFQAHLPTLGLILPVGISFYTFQTISYSVDVYRGQRPAVRSPLDFALYVAFFPQLVAGPIERSTTLLPQFQRPRQVNREDWQMGLTWIAPDLPVVDLHAEFHGTHDAADFLADGHYRADLADRIGARLAELVDAELTSPDPLNPPD